MASFGRVAEQVSQGDEDFLDTLKSRNKKNTFEQMPPEVAKRIFRIYFSKLNNHGQSYTLSHANYDNAQFVKTPWGGICLYEGVGENINSYLSIYIAGSEDQPEVVGYGGMKEDRSERSAYVTFKVFPEDRRKVKGKELFQEGMFGILSLVKSDIQRLIAPPEQQYNPQIEQNATPAPVMYRKLGFRPRSGEPQRLPNLSAEELKQLAQEELYLDIPQEVRNAFAETRRFDEYEELNEQNQRMLNSLSTEQTIPNKTELSAGIASWISRS